MDVAAQFHLHVMAMPLHVHQRVKITILRQVLNLHATAPCSAVVTAHLVKVLTSTVFGKVHRSTMEKVPMNFGAW